MQSRDEILTTFTEILVDSFEVAPEDITLEANLFADLDLDSLDAPIAPF